MPGFHIIALLVSLVALFAYINYKLLRLPVMVGLMLQSLLLSLLLILLLEFGVDIARPAQELLKKIDFDKLLLEGILCFLLFAGSLFVKVEELIDVKFDIALYAVAGVAISAAIIGGTLYGFSLLLGLGLRPEYCFLFGALISPTDPVAVLPTLRAIGIPDRISAQIAGESLFNDGIGIVMFLSILSLLGGDKMQGGAVQVLLLFLREALGGVAFGAVLGWGGYFLIKSVDNFRLEILITLAMVTGGYSLATLAKVSGPLAMVMAGLLIGGRGRKLAMSDKTRENLDQFWDLIEKMLNAILFTLIGFEVLLVSSSMTYVHMVTSLVAIPLVLLGRCLSLLVLGGLFRQRGGFSLRTVWIMTWSGLRGGIPIALAISLPESGERTVLIVATYAVVVFSILVQGTTLGLFEKRA